MSNTVGKLLAELANLPSDTPLIMFTNDGLPSPVHVVPLSARYWQTISGKPVYALMTEERTERDIRRITGEM